MLPILCMTVMFSRYSYSICLLYIMIQCVTCTSSFNKHYYALDASPENDIADFVYSKSRLPSEIQLPKPSLIKTVDNDAPYILSKLSDQELIKLLNTLPKKSEYGLDDIVDMLFNSKSIDVNRQSREKPYDDFTYSKNKGKGTSDKMGYFKIDHRSVNPSKLPKRNTADYNALEKLNNLLFNYQRNLDTEFKSGEDLEKRKLLFDVLVSQLKSLCCDKPKYYSKFNPKSKQEDKHNEYIFLVVNEEIKSKDGDDDLILVDPDSLGNNCSVLLLGPITTKLSDAQLKRILKQISNELSNPEYLPILQQLAEGNVIDKKIMKSTIIGSDSRRYIKPHRCNHQSKLAKVYGGPKWIICTGYLNLNTPSLYD